MAFDFLFRRESADDHHQSRAASDLDLITSPKDGALVAVVQEDGVHVCWQCFEQFIESAEHKLRPVEFNPGGEGTRILIHSKCVKQASRGKSDGRLFWDAIRGHQRRRAVTRLSKPFEKLRSGDSDAG
ncbi:MAG: hypothetical protein ACE10O_05505 [Candidatus Acidiferrales bacterium]